MGSKVYKEKSLFGDDDKDHIKLKRYRNHHGGKLGNYSLLSSLMSLYTNEAFQGKEVTRDWRTEGAIDY